MLRLKKIEKIYSMGSNEVHALKGLTINFRKNEFVAVLGPSGCGKTTLLNIIGGLDKYTSGDLIIEGTSTKKYKDSDWDIYRNHRIGFVFQSYNLIPHQSVLENVELALTISGLEKSERIEKAKIALDKVGLEGLYNKKPNQLSGGQCQRVAIARALVNEPDILLADEPTGALDTVTSVQIMDLIKEIAKERLVIMVTHNPELADKYATRIVKLLDGEISSDSNPYTDELEEKQSTEKVTKTKMSFWTAFKLSGRNLLSKFKRTLMVGLAGSIGIIGISLVLALSSGIRNYINTMQEDMLSGNPIKIEETAFDLNVLSDSMSDSEKAEIVIKNGVVNVSKLLETLAERAAMVQSIIVSNEITQDYIDYLLEMPEELLEELFFDYGVSMSPSIYTDLSDGVSSETKMTSLTTVSSIYKSILDETKFKDSSAFVSTLAKGFSQSINNTDYLLTQYDLLDGEIADEADELMLVVNDDQQINDLTLINLGFYSQKDMFEIAEKAFDSEREYVQKTEFSFEELYAKKFMWHPNSVIYTQNPLTKTFSHNTIVSTSSEESLELRIVGVLKPKDNLTYGTLSNGFYYTPALVEYARKCNKNSDIVNYLVEKDAEGFGLIDAVRYTYEYIVNGETKMKTDSISGGSSFASGNMITLSIANLGGGDLATSISIYPTNFEDKEQVLAYLDAWNDDGDIVVNGKTITKDERARITYTDPLSLVISMVNTMIDVVTTALIAFTAISLVVSTVMISIITYVSVVERIKEIGVIRSLGGRKKDVARLFNAETFIIGLAAGLLGIGITYLISIIANIIIGGITGIYTLVALPVYQAIIMVVISISLTLISGLFPSRAAANMDPVNALRSE